MPGDMVNAPPVIASEAKQSSPAVIERLPTGSAGVDGFAALAMTASAVKNIVITIY